MGTEVFNMRESQARSRDLVIRFLQQTTRKFVERYKDPNLPVLIPEDQHALRIFAAAVRRIENEYDAAYADDAQVRLRATLALHLRDNGDLVRYAGSVHSRGRLACPACDFAYSGLLKEPQCVLCHLCKMGVEHVRTIAGPAFYEDPLGNVNVRDNEIIRWTLCDECGSRSITPVKE